MRAILAATIDAGLGNQLFLVAAAWVCAVTHKCPLLILTARNNKHNRAGRDYTELLFRHLGTPLGIATGSGDHHRFVREHSMHPTPFVMLQPWSPDQFPAGSVLHGYFQYYPPLAPHADTLRSIVNSALTTALGPCKRDVSQMAFLHIRRGDYLAAQHVHPIVPISYYERAIRRLDETVRILVFCEDREWYESQPLFQTERFEYVDNPDELECLQLMSECKAGAICANSTFSWWGAFLGAHGVNAPVFVPAHWVHNQVHTLWPETWIPLT